MTQTVLSPSLPDNTPTSSKTGSTVTVLQSILTGSVAGITEVAIDHPLITIKIRQQRGDPFTFNPRVLYRGILTNAGSMVPVTALQVSLNRIVHRVFFDNNMIPSHTERLACAFVAGMGSSLVSCPAEMVITHQSNTGGSFFLTAGQIMGQRNPLRLWTALPATALREGIFSVFFLGVTPALKKQIISDVNNDHAASILAGVTAGAGAAIVSQTADTIKTQQQTTGIRFSQAMSTLYRSHGAKGFFRGGLPRGINVMSAVTVMGWVTEKMEAVLHQHNAAIQEKKCRR